jgi:uncharacterized RDD family membrane protein YckC
MKCPKCGYLGFENVDRCRNCGYDFSLSASIDLPELSLRRDTQTLSPLDDLALLDAAVSSSAAPLPPVEMPASLTTRAPAAASDPPAPAPAPPLAEPPASRSELPLFGSNDDEPLITRASPPRPPLAVRRATPEVPRLRGEQSRMHTLDLDLDARVRPLPPVDAGARAQLADWPATVDALERAQDAPLGARVAAAAIDLIILLSVDAIVIYFTMQICGLAMSELDVLPKAPLIAFLLVQNGGYLVVFTAGGQTLGKMAAGIKVVTAGSGSPLDLGRAVIRTLVWLILALPIGLGFLTALLSSDHRGLHDRFARTRVVRVSA